ncbi:MAG: PIN domain-containing protein [Candidatus Aureabacteria bacterium]|nr:PIN domain-containing protein [Candidatus Auribacterota bacterium]
MKVLVDTCIWSAVLRHKKPDSALIKKMKDLIDDGRVTIVGPIRQELLSEVYNLKQFNHLKEILSSFEDIPLKTKHFVTAAEFSNTCRAKGIQGSTIDYLICAVAHLENLTIFTTDKDFEHYKKYLSIQLIK